jgi:hypothetical protein
VTDVLRNKTVDAYTTFAAFLTMDTMRIRYAMRLTSRIGEDMINAKQTIGQIARSEPAAIEVFRSQGIQYCCHGKEEIASASKTVGISAGGLLTKIYQAKRHLATAEDPGWIPFLKC